MIRRGTLNDVAGMALIFNHYVRTSTVIFSNDELTAADMRSRMEPVAGHFPFYVAETPEGELAGYCYAHHWHPNAVYGRTWEITIYLSHRFTGRGIGRELLGKVVEESRKAGAHTLVSCVTAGNEPCERLHRSMGFEKAGVLKAAGFKFGRYLDDVFYQLML